MPGHTDSAVKGPQEWSQEPRGEKKQEIKFLIKRNRFERGNLRHPKAESELTDTKQGGQITRARDSMKLKDADPQRTICQ